MIPIASAALRGAVTGLVLAGPRRSTPAGPAQRFASTGRPFHVVSDSAGAAAAPAVGSGPSSDAADASFTLGGGTGATTGAAVRVAQLRHCARSRRTARGEISQMVT